MVSVEQIEGALGRMPLGARDGLESEVLRDCATRLMRVEAQTRAQPMAVTRALDATGVAKPAGAASTGAMLANTFGGDLRAADQLVHQAKTLRSAPATEQALAGGLIGPSQAAIIASAVADLPEGTTAEPVDADH